MNRIKLFIILVFINLCVYANSDMYVLHSPDSMLKVSVTVSDKLTYDISYNNKSLLENSEIGICIDSNEFKAIVRSSKRYSIDEKITPVVPLKFAVVRNHCNGLVLNLKGRMSVEFRAYNDGISYRFITDRKGQNILVHKEIADYNLPGDYILHMQQPTSFKTPYEEPYSHVCVKDWNEASKLCLLPLLVDTRKGVKLLFSESDLYDYPCMFFKANGGKGILADFPHYPLQTKIINDRSINVVSEAGYIAKTEGKRRFPWRYIVVADNDGKLVENTFTCRLATQAASDDMSWVRPGQVSWEWWNHTSPYGVDFVAGRNQETYKYYIDFASRFNIPYVLFDEGWAKSTTNPYEVVETLDMKELIAYAKKKNVGVLLWVTWLAVENNFELFEEYEKWGVAGVKIDFMDHSDQWMVNYYERVAKEAAKHHLLVNFHGSFKPAGLEYKYPNILSYEGVLGMEQGEFCCPENSIYHPFIRNAVGPMDYTPGAMITMQPEYFTRHYPNNASVGTRAYQMALYVVFESGFQMLSDNPTFYYKEKDCTDFMANVPVTWDETNVIAASLGEYLVVAKRKGKQWFIGGITANKSTDISINLDFLENDKTYNATVFKDGLNAGCQALDYIKAKQKLSKNDKLHIKMERNGGFAIVLK